MTELYKAGIIEVTEAEDEDEDLFEVAVHFDGDIFLPNVVFAGKDHALRQAKKLYDWLEANHKEIKGEQLRWQSYTVNRESLRVSSLLFTLLLFNIRAKFRSFNC
ncbi:hypothetical protein [Nostoc sp.]